MTWTVEFLDTAALAELEAMPVDIRARFARIVELIEGHGLERVGEPHLKHLEGKLWEMRMKGRDGIARSLYVTATGRRVVGPYLPRGQPIGTTAHGCTLQGRPSARRARKVLHSGRVISAAPSTAPRASIPMSATTITRNPAAASRKAGPSPPSKPVIVSGD